MLSFQFVIKDNSAKAFRLFFWFLLFLQVTAAAVVVLLSSNKWLTDTALVAISLYFAATLFYFFYQKKKSAFIICQLCLYVIFIAFWLIQSGIIAMLICILIVYFSYILQTKKSLVVFSAEEIVIKRIFSFQHFLWNEIEHVILKDNILTIDFKSNKFIQVEIMNEPAYDESIFNGFVKDRILKNQSNY